jgi:gas vesicle protein
MGIATPREEQNSYHTVSEHVYMPPSDDSVATSKPKRRATGSSYRNVPDSRSISMLGLGMVIGVAIGAGVALLAAPRSGEETRDRIRDRVRHIRGKDDAWTKLQRELKRAVTLRRRTALERRKLEDQKIVERQRAESDARVVAGTTP